MGRSGYRDRPAQLPSNRETIARGVWEIFDHLPGYSPEGKSFNFKGSKPYKMASSIVHLIIDALTRGESVCIRGFGTWSVVTQKPTRRRHMYFYGNVGTHSDIAMRPGVIKVRFRPSALLREYVLGKEFARD